MKHYKLLTTTAALLIALFLGAAAVAQTGDGKVYTVAEQMPQFPGGDSVLLDFIEQNLQYPSDTCAHGKVIVQFVVTSTGKVGEVNVARSLSPECDAEAVRVIKSLPDFIPGRQNGQPVDVQFTLPVMFKRLVIIDTVAAPEGPDTSTLASDSQEVDADSIYTSVEQMPQYPGGDAALIRFIAEELRYPPEASRNHEEGTVVVSFVVDRNGEVGSVYIVRSAGQSLDEEAMRVVNMLRKFTPGRKYGQPVNVWYTLPVTFRSPYMP